MRRARIKAVANVPVRRKVAPDAAAEAGTPQTDAAKPSEKSTDKKDDPVLDKQETATEAITSKIDIKTEAFVVKKEDSIVVPQQNSTISTGTHTQKLDVKASEKPLVKIEDSVSEKRQEDKEKNEEQREKEENKSSETIDSFNTEKEKDKEKTESIVSTEKLSIATNEKKKIQIETFSKEKENDSSSISACNGKEKLITSLPFSGVTKESDEKRPSSLDQKLKSPQKSTNPPIEGSPVKAAPTKSYFTRPIPRLDGGGRIRRNSIQGSGASASESEDDSRRSSCFIPNRVRNDSMCSVQSLKDSGNISKLSAGQKRKMVVSESARKLAEARREFLIKHENAPPDKAKLTMYDLIYYNPTTNPMKQKPTRPKQNERRDSISSMKTDLEKEKEEDIAEKPAEMVVPQVKIGPNGELVIDEQSLVIDQRKGQEDIDRSDILVEDDSNGGFYKRRQKSKDWSKWETLKFYKALNTYGTDFLLMQSIFPKRSRQELKLKYKKEERVNQALIEKALRYQEFDIEALEKDIAKVEEDERLETESKKKAGRKRGSNSSAQPKKKRQRCKTLLQEVTCEDDEENSDSNKQKNDDDPVSESENVNKEPKPTVRRRRAARKRKVIQSDGSASNESANENSESEKEVFKTKPTRSGRVPKRAKKSPPPVQISDVEKEAPTKSKRRKKDKENNSETVLNIPDVQNNVITEISDTSKEKDIQEEDNNNDEKGFKIKKTAIKPARRSSAVNLETKKNTSAGSTKKSPIKNSSDRDSENPEDQDELLETLGVGLDIKSDGLEKIIDDIPIQPEGLDNIVADIPNHAIDSDNISNQPDISNNVSVDNLHQATDSNSSNNTMNNNKTHQLDSLNTIKDNNAVKLKGPNNVEDKKSKGSSIVQDDTISGADNLGNIVDGIPNMENLKPGSLVVLKKDCADTPGKTTLQVYIVSSNFDSNNPNYKESLLPVELPPDILKTVTNCIEDIEPENLPQ